MALNQELDDYSTKLLDRISAVEAENEANASKVEDLQERVTNSATIQRELTAQLKEAESRSEFYSLECQMAKEEADNARNQIYIGRKNDEVDQALAEYLTKQCDRDGLRIMFVRVSEGVYQFGQRRIFIKRGAKRKDGQQSLLVKVGGGFIGIDKFIEQFTQPEVDKVDNRKEEFTTIYGDRLSRFHEKM